MVEEGETAPSFELPAFREGEFEQIALEEHLGEDVIILAFYPGDFNPACDGTASGLDGLDLFTMQKDITILAVSGDSVFSHRAFADEYDLHIPLLSDVRGEVAAEYGVAADDDRYVTERAVFVIDHSEAVEYAWVADDIEQVPDTDEIRAAIENVGDDETAQARYRVGHAHYVEGRRAFTSAMGAYEDSEWMLSSRDFGQAAEEFDEAREEFNTAVRFSDDDEATRYFERAERKAEALWRAAGWLTDSAESFASGEGRRGDELRQDAEGPLETARDIHEPPSPDDFPPEVDPREEETKPSFLPGDDEEVDNTLELDEDAVAAEAESADATGDGQPATDHGDPENGQEPADALTGGSAETPDEATLTRGGGEDEESETEDIDESELEAITAELEEQNEAPRDGPDGPPSDVTDSDDRDTETDSDVATVDDETEDDDLELELTDPTEGVEDEGDEKADDDEDLSEDIGEGDHGVPDSL
jgi:peroxiredoxin